jgi:ribonucleoside-diphosphate reductase beta chain
LEERPELNTIDLEMKIVEACFLSVDLEFAFIDKVFEMGNLENLTKEQLKNFIRARANEKMVELRYKAQYVVDEKLLDEMAWFGQITSGVEHQDFFAMRPSAYSKSTADWSDF